jgi:hypothetical protein
MITKRFDPFDRVSSRYGAPMGRPSNSGLSAAWTPATRLCARHQGGGGGYDRGGAYWGFPSDVWAVWEHGRGEDGVAYVRAPSRQAAINMALEDSQS